MKKQMLAAALAALLAGAVVASCCNEAEDGPPEPAPSLEVLPAEQEINLPPPDAAELHNKYRSEAGVPPVTWSAELAEEAAVRAESLSARGCVLIHTPGLLGENLHWSSRDETPEEIVASWASESRYWTPGDGCEEDKVCGHYTQLVWSTTREVGCATARCLSGGQVTVCLYDPPGNVSGKN